VSRFGGFRGCSNYNENWHVYISIFCDVSFRRNLSCLCQLPPVSASLVPYIFIYVCLTVQIQFEALVEFQFCTKKFKCLDLVGFVVLVFSVDTVIHTSLFSVKSRYSRICRAAVKLRQLLPAQFHKYSYMYVSRRNFKLRFGLN